MNQALAFLLFNTRNSFAEKKQLRHYLIDMLARNDSTLNLNNVFETFSDGRVWHSMDSVP